MLQLLGETVRCGPDPGKCGSWRPHHRIDLRHRRRAGLTASKPLTSSLTGGPELGRTVRGGVPPERHCDGM